MLIAVGAVVLSVRRQLNPPLNPNAKIVLSVAPAPIYAGKATGNQIVFARDIKASNSPQEGINIRYDERVVAKGHGHTQVIFGTAPSPTPPYLSSWFQNGGGGGWSRASTNSISRLQGETIELPVWTTQLEWQGEVAAAPRENGGDSRPAPSATIQALGQLRGAAYMKKKLPIPVSSQAVDPIQKFQLEPLGSANVSSDVKSLHIDTCVRFEFKNSKSRIFRQLVAFDGKTRRILWSEGADFSNPYGYSENIHTSSNYPKASDALLLRLRKVPTSWGKVTLFFNIAFAPQLNAGADWEGCDEATFRKLKSQGWLAFSRKLVVRE